MYKRGRTNFDIIKDYLGTTKVKSLTKVLSEELEEGSAEKAVETLVELLKEETSEKVKTIIEKIYFPDEELEDVAGKVEKIEKIWQKLILSKNTEKIEKRRR